LATSLQSLMVTTDHAVPIEPYGGSAVVTVDQTGGTVYYADNFQVSAANNQGSIAPGGTQTFTSNVWIRGSATAGVTVQLTTGGPYTAWRFRKQITVDHTKATGTVAPFVASLDLSSDTDVRQANQDLSDLRFTDGGLNPLSYAVDVQGGAELFNDASWCWFNDPRVICYRGSFNRVYAANMIGATGTAQVTQFDVDTQAIVQGILHSAFEVDDHSCPGIVALPSGKIMAFYAQHNTTTGLIFYRTTTAAEDVSAWNAEQSFQASLNTQNACYANPHLLSSENAGAGRMYVFFRDNHSQLSYVTSDNYTAATPTWNATQPIITNGTTAFIYNKQINNGVDRIDICFTDDAPDLAGTGGATVGTNNLYHVFVKGGNVCAANGTVISSLASLGTGLTPATLQAAGAMVASNAQGGPFWTWDITYDASGKPCFVYVSYPNADWSGILYHYARWTGSAWQTSTITTAGNTMSSPNLNTAGGTATPSYAGGIAIFPDDVNYVYLSRQVSKQGAQQAFEIEKWRTLDLGLNWSPVVRVSPGVMRKNTRPVCPRNRRLLTTTPPEVLFMSDAYTSYQNISQSLLAYPAPPGMNVKRGVMLQLPSVDNATDKTVYMYYGKPNVTDAGTTSLLDASTKWAQPLIFRASPNNAYNHADAFTPGGIGAFTLSGWATMQSGVVDGVADFFYSSANLGARIQGVRLWMVNGVPSGDIQSTGGVTGGAFADKTGLSDGNQHHYAMTYDGTTLSLWVDGVISTTTFTVPTPPRNLAGGGGSAAADIGWSPAAATRRAKASFTGWQFDTVTRPASWIQTQAQARSGLVTVGSSVARQW
jgi:BNR repeat-containing family member